MRSISIVLLTVLLTVGGRVWAQAHAVQWIADPEFAGKLRSATDILPKPVEMNYVHDDNFNGFKDRLREIGEKTRAIKTDVFINIVSHGEPGLLLTSYIQPANEMKYAGNWIPYEEIADAILELANKNHDLTVNVNLMACFSGSFLTVLKKKLEHINEQSQSRSRPRINVMVSTDDVTKSENGWGIITFDSELGQVQAQINLLKEKFKGLFKEKNDYEWIQKIVGLGPRHRFNHPKVGRPVDNYTAWSSYRDDLYVWTNEQLLAILDTDRIPNDRQKVIVARLKAQGFDVSSHPITSALASSCEAALLAE